LLLKTGDELSVFDNVELPLMYQKVPTAECKQRVDGMLEKVGIITRHDHMPQQLSGGQQQRVAVARAIVGKPAKSSLTNRQVTWIRITTKR